MIAAKYLAGSTASLDHLHAGRKHDEIKRVRSWSRKSGPGGDFLLEHFSNGAVLHGFTGLGCSESGGSDARAMADLFSGNAVFAKLIEERAGENEIEELIDALDEIALRRLLPGRAPKYRKDLSGREQGAVAVGQLRSGLRDGWCCGFRPMHGDDADGMTRTELRFLPTRLGGHDSLLMVDSDFLANLNETAGRRNVNGAKQKSKWSWDGKSSRRGLDFRVRVYKNSGRSADRGGLRPRRHLEEFQTNLGNSCLVEVKFPSDFVGDV